MVQVPKAPHTAAVLLQLVGSLVRVRRSLQKSAAGNLGRSCAWPRVCCLSKNVANHSQLRTVYTVFIPNIHREVYGSIHSPAQNILENSLSLKWKQFSKVSRGSTAAVEGVSLSQEPSVLQRHAAEPVTHPTLERQQFARLPVHLSNTHCNERRGGWD